MNGLEKYLKLLSILKNIINQMKKLMKIMSKVIL